MKHILIPTDFSLQSLNAVHAAVATHSEQPFKITLLHLLRMAEDIPQLLFRSMRSKQEEIITPDFREACEILQNRYESSIASIHIKLGFGSTKSYVQNLLEGEKIDLIFCCPDIQLALPSPRSVEMMSLLRKTGVIIETVPSRIGRETFTESKNEQKEPGLRIPKNLTEYAVEK